MNAIAGELTRRAMRMALRWWAQRRARARAGRVTRAPTKTAKPASPAPTEEPGQAARGEHRRIAASADRPIRVDFALTWEAAPSADAEPASEANPDRSGLAVRVNLNRGNVGPADGVPGTINDKGIVDKERGDGDGGWAHVSLENPDHPDHLAPIEVCSDHNPDHNPDHPDRSPKSPVSSPNDTCREVAHASGHSGD